MSQRRLRVLAYLTIAYSPTRHLARRNLIGGSFVPRPLLLLACLLLLSTLLPAVSAQEEDLLPIGHIQGSTNKSPYLDQSVQFRGIVTGIMTDRNSEGIVYYTIFLQDPEDTSDGDPQTSDAIAVFHGRRRPRYHLGDLLQVSGQVTEFYGLTEIDDRDLNIELISRNNFLPEPKVLDLALDPTAEEEYLESHETMLVSLVEPARVVGPTHSGCGFALIDALTSQPPLPRQTADDQFQQPMLFLHHSDVNCSSLPDLKTGDLVSLASGPLTYHFDRFKIVIQDTDALELSPAPFPAFPQPFHPTENQFTIATFNLNDHFDGDKDKPDSAEPVIVPSEIELKQSKLAIAIGQTLGCPTIVAIQEIENEHLLRSLAAETAQYCGFAYDVAHRESADSRGIDLALMTDPRRVQLGDIFLHQGCTTIDTGIQDPGANCTSSESPLFSRPPLSVDVQVDGYPYTIINNHLKSKRGREEETNPRRMLQAQHIATLVQDRRAADPHTALIVLGDFNDYEKSPTMLQLTEDTGLFNTLQNLPERDRYSYVYDGVPQLIDGILVSESLLPAVAGTMILHTNADYPIGYASQGAADMAPFHVSDHDLPLLLLDLPQEELPVDPTPRQTPRPSPSPPKPEPTVVQAQEQAADAPGLPLWPIALIVLAAVLIFILIQWYKNKQNSER